MPPPPSALTRVAAMRAMRVLLIIVVLGGWFGTQALLARRSALADGSGIGDALFTCTASLNAFFAVHPTAANALLAVTSALIDLLGLFLLASAVLGRTIRPFLGLLMLFALRQICQGLCALPTPQGMIWHNPGFPSLLVTYGTTTDFFFSGHTAIAVYGATELARLGRRWLTIAGVVVAAVEAATVIVLRAHYTLDVFTGIVAALWISGVAARLAPPVDRALNRLVGSKRS
jgi:hypothetical protein